MQVISVEVVKNVFTKQQNLDAESNFNFVSEEKERCIFLTIE